MSVALIFPGGTRIRTWPTPKRMNSNCYTTFTFRIRFRIGFSKQNANVISRGSLCVMLNAVAEISDVKNQDVEELLEILNRDDSRLQALSQWKGSLSHATVAAVFQRVKDADSALIFFNWTGFQVGYKLCAFSLNNFLEALIRTGQHDEAYRYFKLSWPVNTAPDSFTYGILIRGFFKLGKLRTACELYEEMTKRKITPQIHTCNYVLEAQFRLGEVSTAVVCFREMKCIPTYITWTIMIDGLFKASKVVEALELFREMKKHAIPTVQTYNVVIDGLCKIPNMDEAYKMLGESSAAGYSPTVITYTSLMCGHCKSGEISKAYDFLEVMNKNGVCPNLVAYNILMDGFCKTRQMSAAYKLLDEMTAKGVLPDRYTYNIIIGGLCHVARIDEASLLLQNMCTEGGSFEPDAVSYNTLIDGLCKGNRVNEAKEVFVEMTTVKGLKPSILTYNSLIYGLCQMSRLSEAQELLEEIRKENCIPNASTYCALITGLSKAGRVDYACELLTDMISDGCKPNLIIYNTVLSGLRNTNKMEQALELLQVMYRTGVVPNRVTYVMVIGGLCKNGRVDEGFEIFREMLSKGVKPHPDTYAILMDALLQRGGGGASGGVQAARHVLEVAISHGSAPPSALLFERLCEAGGSGDGDGDGGGGGADVAYKLFQRMRPYKMMADAGEYSALVAGYCSEGNLKAAQGIFSEMLRYGCSPSITAYNSIMHEMAEDRTALGDVYGLLQKFISEKRCIPDEAIYAKLIAGYCEVGDVDEAYRILKEMTDTWLFCECTSYGLVVEGLCRKGKTVKAYDVLLEMRSKGCSCVGRDTYERLLQDLCNLSEMSMAVQVARDMLEQDFMFSDNVNEALISWLVDTGRHEEAEKLRNMRNIP